MPKPESFVPAPSTEVQPRPELEKRTRRSFSPDYKLRIIREADVCQHGEVGALLRREKLYANQLSQWRRELAQQGVAGLSKSAPGSAARKTPEQRRIEQLEKQVIRLRQQIAIKDNCLALQKKALAMHDRLDNETGT